MKSVRNSCHKRSRLNSKLFRPISDLQATLEELELGAVQAPPDAMRQGELPETAQVEDPSRF